MFQLMKNQNGIKSKQGKGPVIGKITVMTLSPKVTIYSSHHNDNYYQPP